MISRLKFLLKFYSVFIFSLISPCLLLAFDPVVTQFTEDGKSYAISLATDNNGNARVALIDDGVIKTATSINSGEWSPLESISTGTPSADKLCIAMSPTGTALVAWTEIDELNNYSLITAYHTGNVWTTPTPNPLDSAISGSIINNLSISMNSAGEGLLVWVKDDMMASFFSGGVWSSSVNIGPNFYTSNISTAYSANGKASAVWHFGDFVAGERVDEIYANTFDGTNWQTTPVLLESNSNDDADSGIDALGNTIAVWSSNTNGQNILASRFDGLTWSTPEVISAAGDNRPPKIAVDPEGRAVVVWEDATSAVQMNIFDGSNWSGQMLIVDYGENPVVTMDDSGNVLLGWVASSNGYYATMVKGTSLIENTTLISENILVNNGFEVALSNNSTAGYAVWGSEAEGSNTFGARLFIPSPPENLRAQVCSARFAGVLDCDNTLTWDASIDPDIDHYDIYRDDVLIDSVLASAPLRYSDIALCKATVVYSITTVNSVGVASASASITVGP